MPKPVAKPRGAKPKKRRSAFVPRIVLPVALAAAVPVTVLAACGSSTEAFVAAVAYTGYDAGTGGSSTSTSSSSSSSSSGTFVAAVAYPAYEAGTG